MPLDRLAKDPLYNFLGVNLRRDRLSMAEGDMARAINADLHTQPGIILLRKGMRPRDDSVLASAVRQIARHNAFLYRLAGTALYRGNAGENVVSIVTGLSALAPIALASYRPLNDNLSWTFIAQGAIRQKDEPRTQVTYTWGITPPASAPTLTVGAAGALTGDYGAVYTYVRLVNNAIAHESNPSPSPTAIALTADQLGVAVVASTDPQVTNIRIYRTLAGGQLYLFDQEVANATATIASTKTDNQLGAAVELDNDVPPSLGAVAEYQAHFFGVGDPVHPDYLWYAKRFRPESWPSNQFLRIGSHDDPLQTVVRQAGFLGVFSRRSKYRVSGNAVSGFAWAETLNTRGTIVPHAVLATSAGVGFWATDGIFATNFLQADQEISAAIAPIFEPEGDRINGYAPIAWDQPLDFSLAEYKRRIYAGYRDIDGRRLIAVYDQQTTQWYHYAHPCTSLYLDETFDRLLMGTTTGETMILESGTTDNNVPIALDVQTRSLVGIERFVRKIFKFFKLDVAAIGATGGTVTLYIDDVAHQTITVTSESRLLLRAPQRLQDIIGYSWSLTITGSVQLYGAEMLYSPLEDV